MLAEELIGFAQAAALREIGETDVVTGDAAPGGETHGLEVLDDPARSNELLVDYSAGLG